jgi:hypothetical protein
LKSKLFASFKFILNLIMASYNYIRNSDNNNTEGMGLVARVRQAFVDAGEASAWNNFVLMSNSGFTLSSPIDIHLWNFLVNGPYLDSLFTGRGFPEDGVAGFTREELLQRFFAGPSQYYSGAMDMEENVVGHRVPFSNGEMVAQREFWDPNGLSDNNNGAREVVVPQPQQE